MQYVGMADQDARPGILQDVIDFLRLEVPIGRHRIGAKPHRGIGGLDKGDVVAHQDANAAALFDAKCSQSAGEAVGAIADFGMTAPALTADDAKERWLCLGHCLVLVRKP